MKKATRSLAILAFFVLAFLPQKGFSQDDLLSLLGEDETTDYATAAFKTNRVINGHSIENTAPGVLDFKISHRFSPLDEPLYDLFGLDGASIRFGFDYGITDRLMVGAGRNSLEKIYDGFVKYKILRQSSGKKRMPITLTYLADAQVVTQKFANKDRDNFFSSRLFYTHQLLIGRKFSDKTSLQIMPTLVHRNLVKTKAEASDVISIGFAGRQKLTKRLALTAEYYWVLPDQLAAGYDNSLAVGIDIETGGHVFQLHFTNATSMSYKGFITETVGSWPKDTRFGFNVSRVFTIGKAKH